MKVKLIAPQVMKPAIVMMFVSHVNTDSAELCTLMNDKNAKAPEVRTATIGRPAFVQYAKTFGACPRIDRPYRIRDEQNRKELDAENAEDFFYRLIRIMGHDSIKFRVPLNTH